MYLAFMSPVGAVLKSEHPLLWSGPYADLLGYARRQREAVLMACAHPAIGIPSHVFQIKVADGIWQGRHVPVYLMSLVADLSLKSAKRISGFAANVARSDAIFLGSFIPSDLEPKRVTEVLGFCPKELDGSSTAEEEVTRFGAYLELAYPSIALNAFAWEEVLMVPGFSSRATDSLLDDAFNDYEHWRAAKGCNRRSIRVRHSDRHGWTTQVEQRPTPRQGSCHEFGMLPVE